MNDMTHPEIPESVAIARPTLPETEATALEHIAQGFVVDSEETAELAAEELRGVKTMLKTVEDERTKITKPLNDAVKAVNALFAKLSSPLQRAESIYKGKILQYRNEQERKRREEQAKAEAAARAERERLEKEAQKLEKKGKAEEAAAKRDIAAMMPESMPAAPAPKVEGFSVRKNWKSRVTNKMDVIKFVAANPAFEYLLDVNASKADALAKQHEKGDIGVPGLEGYNAAVASIR